MAFFLFRKNTKEKLGASGQGVVGWFPAVVMLVVLLIGCGREADEESKSSIEVPVVDWMHLSSSSGELPTPNAGNQQTATLVADLDRDGVNDFVITERTEGPAVVWYRRTNEGWDRYIIENEALTIEAGSAYGDIDGDGDMDLVFGGDGQSNEIWWWENPYPDFEPSTAWTRRVIKSGGANKHHDQIFADLNGDSREELIFWNQGDRKLFVAPIPEDVTKVSEWELVEIYAYEETDTPQKGRYPSWKRPNEHEGLAIADVDGDGTVDIVGGGRWFKHRGDFQFDVHEIDPAYAFTRSIAGQFIPGGRPEIMLVAGDGAAPLIFYEWKAGSWMEKVLIDTVYDGHSINLVDYNEDGHLDIFLAEMELGNHPDKPKARVMLGNGEGDFETVELLSGFGWHESRMVDLDGDGDLDILGKPYTWDAPRLDIWLNEGTEMGNPALSSENWERHQIVRDLPDNAIYVHAEDLDGDGLRDIIAGAYWYKNPGKISDNWEAKTIGGGMTNMALLHDFDGDGHMDVLGTTGKMPQENRFLWAKNDGKGNFTTYANIGEGDGDFLQGIAIARFVPDGPYQIALSWHAAEKGIQMITLPDNPLRDEWTIRKISPHTLDEDLSVGDINRNGLLDLFQGTQWIENPGTLDGAWNLHVIGEVTAGEPDRNNLLDFNKDGKLDAVVGLENGTDILLFLQKDASGTSWHRKIIASNVGGGFSMDAGDIDGDGLADVVLGEHRGDPSNRLIIYENTNNAKNWIPHVVDTGLETDIDHHDGTVLVDIENDGDLDILSIGWYNKHIWVYENTSN
ncbi:FG-GAP repeat domain-containing protein [Cyclobacterium xiamenense]|uniref:FG-GAP repeat domain-containing protein n=1 Tax=Cyclobacterium xiamenense TaxID=1297121 RepID=UPI0035CF686A